MDIAKEIRNSDYDHLVDDKINVNNLYFIIDNKNRKVIQNNLGSHLMDYYDAEKWSEVFGSEFYSNQYRKSFSVFYRDIESGRLIKCWEQFITGEGNYNPHKSFNYSNDMQDNTSEMDIYNPQPRPIHPTTRSRKSEMLMAKSMSDMANMANRTLQDQIDYANTQVSMLNDQIAQSQASRDQLARQMAELSSTIRAEYDNEIKEYRSTIQSKDEEIYSLRAEIKELTNKLETERWKNDHEKKFDDKLRKMQEENSGSMLSDIAGIIPIVTQIMGANGGNNMPVQNTLTNNASAGNYRPPSPPPRIVRSAPPQAPAMDNFEDSEIELV